MHGENASAPRPIVFLGPSISAADAGRWLDADFRPPAGRGDFEGITPGAVVGLIDGVFDHHLAVSPTELRQALERGVTIYGSSSMGALRANEVPGVVGVGKVYELFRRGEIEDDDEVAVAFDPESGRSLSVPMVNVRHAVERLVGPGTLSTSDGNRLLQAAKSLPYPERIYPLIVKASGLAHRADARELIAMLSLHDLKRADAITLLERLRELPPRRTHARAVRLVASPEPPPRSACNPDAPVHFWEFGPPVSFARLVWFLKMTGAFARHLARAMSSETPGWVPSADDVALARGQLLQRLRTAWHWVSDEEVTVTLRDLGLEPNALAQAVDAEASRVASMMAASRAPPEALLRALRIELFFDDVALKREAARLDSLERLAASARPGAVLTAAERGAAADKLCEGLDASTVAHAVELLQPWGVSGVEVEQYVELLAWARRSAKETRTRRVVPGRLRGLKPSPKVRGEGRFCLPVRTALRHAQRLGAVVGVTRVAVITDLSDLGIPNAQAFRPTGSWSSTVGSGKSTCVTGAKVGAVMEEVEKWAQERYQPAEALTESYETLRHRGKPVIDPATLDLPYDSCYRSQLAIGWLQCDDLISGRRHLVPSAALLDRRLENDIFFSSHGGRKIFSSNGLASGFTFEEALTHGICECIERHALILSAVVGGNPGGPGLAQTVLVDLDTVPDSTAKLVRQIHQTGRQVRIRDLSDVVGVPTFHATLLTPVEGALSYQEAWKEHVGHAAHPNPRVAIDMALLEAVQTVLTDTAGAREDITLHARSLGRHERTKVRRWSAYVAARAPTVERRRFAASSGLCSSDARQDVKWLRDRLAAAGFPHVLVCDLSRPELLPARVIRALVPGTETVNPFYTGPRARAGLLEDLM